MKVAQVMAGAAHGGAENFYVRLVKALHQRNSVEQAAFIRPHPHRMQELENAGIATHSFRMGGPLDLLDHWRLRRELARFEPDLVMGWMNRANRLLPQGRYPRISRLGNYYDLKYHRGADYWVGNSQGICDYLVRGGMPASRVCRIPNFADETPALPVPRASLATAVDQPVLLAAGRLHPDKAFDTLLRALARVPDAVLWLAGSGPEETALRDLSEELGLTARVRFLGWRSDITALMGAADLFVCSSRHEGLGSIVLESWAHGCPLVATASQGPSELIEDGVTGLLTPIDDPEALAHGINQLIHSPDLRHQLAQRAADHYHRYFSESQIVEQYQQLFARVCLT